MNIALILSGGKGLRLGEDTPKQYLEVNEKPMILYCVEALQENQNIDAIRIVAAAQWQEQIAIWLEMWGLDTKFQGFSEPGETRQLSILSGLNDIAKEYVTDTDTVFIHDAARPNLSQGMIDRTFQAMKGHDGVLPVLPMKDTVYLSSNGETVTSLLNRSEVFAGQAPELFHLKKYLEANKALLPDKIYEINGSTEPAILAGMDIAMIPGEEANYKITTKADLERFQAQLG